MSHSCCNWKEIYSCFTIFTLSNSEKPSWADLVEEGESGTAIKQSSKISLSLSFLSQTLLIMLLSLPGGFKKSSFHHTLYHSSIFQCVWCFGSCFHLNMEDQQRNVEIIIGCLYFSPLRSLTPWIRGY